MGSLALSKLDYEKENTLHEQPEAQIREVLGEGSEELKESWEVMEAETTTNTQDGQNQTAEKDGRGLSGKPRDDRTEKIRDKHRDLLNRAGADGKPLRIRTPFCQSLR